MNLADVSAEEVDDVLDRVYAWSKDQGLKGYNKHDGLNSPFLSALLGRAKWPRLVAIQGVMRSPINPRPLLGVPKTYNPKGLALFALGLIDRFRTNGSAAHLDEAQRILRLLLDLRSRGDWSGDCWGYSYPWQDPGFYAPAHTPNAVVTSFVCEAFLDGYRVTKNDQYLDVVNRSIRFFRNDLMVLKDTPEELCLSYMPVPMQMRVMDVSILIGAVIAQYAALGGHGADTEYAARLVTYVINQQTDSGAWYYTDPPTDSPIRHDNYHTGFILDAISRCVDATGNTQWLPSYNRGLTFYAAKLFNDDGSPRWMSDQDYPHDIHGAAQGILTFGRHLDAFPGFAQRIASYALKRMYDAEGRFYYQETRFFRKKFTLLRWNNAWMFRALSNLVRHLREK